MYVDISVSDGTIMKAWVAQPSNSQAKRGLVVFQEAFGVNAHIRDVADRFAKLGFAAIAPELFHRSAGDKFEGSYTNFAPIAPHMQALNESDLSNDIRATYDWLKRNSPVGENIACIGYCMGGRTAFLWGDLDKHIRAEQRQQVAKALREAKNDFVEVVFSNADHGFFCDQRASYQPYAARIAWDLTQSFLNVHVPGS